MKIGALIERGRLCGGCPRVLDAFPQIGWRVRRRDVLKYHEYYARQAAKTLLTEADGIDEMYEQPWPSLPLFTQVRGRVILRSWTSVLRRYRESAASCTDD